ncbi:MAG: recombinase family protein [Pseudomonadota bacterium]
MRPQQEEMAHEQKAVLYCRVSDTKQRKEGNGLDSQEHRCRQYATAKGYDVAAVFPDDISGGGDFMKRPGMVALLSFLDAQPNERFVVIFDDLKRYARDTEFHLKLRREMAMRGATRECLNFNFEDSPEGKFFETIAAAQGELEREQNGRQTRQKMRARVEKGYYCFAPVRGYKYVTLEDGGKMLAPDEPNATIMREALEGFASGRFQTATEVQRFLNGYPSLFRKGCTAIGYQSVFNLLRCPLYAGRMTIKPYGLHLAPAKHEALVSFATWKKIQDRLEGNATAPARKDLSKDFPLRGFVECGCCGHPMTAGWSKGRSRYYGYYICYQKGCAQYGKSVKKDRIEGEFAALLRSLRPAPKLFTLVRAMFADRWASMNASADDRAEAASTELNALERKIDQLLNRLVATENESVISAYERQIAKLEEKKIVLQEKVGETSTRRAPFNAVFRTACAFIADPQKLWDSGVIEYRRTVLRMAFPQRLAYVRNKGFRTAGIAEPFRLLGLFADCDPRVMGAAGIEPATPTMST